MSHEITVLADGTAEAMFAEKPAWHGLGAVVEKAPTSEEALRLAHLDWSVVQWPLYMVQERDGKPARVPIEGRFANCRSDNHDLLGIVTEDYSVVNNVEAFQFLDSLYMDGIIRYESAFSLRGGKQVCMLARMPQVDVIAKGDQICRYILFTTTHDGSGSVRILITTVRVVCANTLAIALHGARGQGFQLRHSGNMEDKLARARKALTQSEKAFKDFAVTADKMAAKKIKKKEDWDTFLDDVLPLPEKKDATRALRRAERDRRDVYVNFKEDPKQSVHGIRGSWWAAVNAVTQFVDHRERKGASDAKRAESRFSISTFGYGNDIKQRAWKRAVEIAGV